MLVLSYGLGATASPVLTGQISPAGVATTELLPGYPRVTAAIESNFLNASRSLPRMTFNPEIAKTIPAPIASASLLAGEVGIYQVNFTIPASNDPIIPCDSTVLSNSLLLVGTSQGVEGIALCVQQ